MTPIKKLQVYNNYKNAIDLDSPKEDKSESDDYNQNHEFIEELDPNIDHSQNIMDQSNNISN